MATQAKLKTFEAETFDIAVKKLQGHERVVNFETRDRIRAAISDLAAAGQHNPERLAIYAIYRSRFD